MAQIVSYFDKNVSFKEGPFVVVNINGFRIECQHHDSSDPCLPMSSIYKVMAILGYEGKSNDKELAFWVCDQLNQMVKDGLIVKRDGVYVDPSQE